MTKDLKSTISKTLGVNPKTLFSLENVEQATVLPRIFFSANFVVLSVVDFFLGKTFTFRIG
jgi:hypothetical protein